MGEVLSPLIVEVVNTSLGSGTLPMALKAALAWPSLKKSSLDAEKLANYQPVLHLPFWTKVLEKVVVR